jgi:DMSO reductase anchor subunit
VHPALSVIVFTTLSGAGYGLLCWIGVYGVAGLLPADRIFGAVSMVLGLGAVTVGLLSSTFHLGHPERAWRAFAQWRTSWLSREGVASVVTYAPILAFGAGWVLLGTTAGVWGLVGLVGAICAIVTVICTAYIYRSLKPIPRWHNHWVVPNYLALSAMTGALLLTMLADMFGYRLPGAHMLALAAIVAALLCKLGYWHFIDNASEMSTPESATGLGSLGKVRLFEAPHTSENYLLKEMGFRIARKHARKLRAIAIALAFALPFALTVAAYAATGVLAAACSLIAAGVALAGVLTERWLFFAEAKHTVTLYYGRSLGASA